MRILPNQDKARTGSLSRVANLFSVSCTTIGEISNITKTPAVEWKVDAGDEKNRTRSLSAIESNKWFRAYLEGLRMRHWDRSSAGAWLQRTDWWTAVSEVPKGSEGWQGEAKLAS